MLPRDPLVVTNRYGAPVNLCDMWAGAAAFLVLAGPSLNDIPLSALHEPGVLSIGCNNAAAFARTRRAALATTSLL